MHLPRHANKASGFGNEPRIVIIARVLIVNPLGLHARPAKKLVDCASRYASDIQLEYDGERVDAKSIMSIMLLAISFGAELSIYIDGKDEKQAKEALIELFHSGFGELE